MHTDQLSLQIFRPAIKAMCGETSEQMPTSEQSSESLQRHGKPNPLPVVARPEDRGGDDGNGNDGGLTKKPDMTPREPVRSGKSKGSNPPQNQFEKPGDTQGPLSRLTATGIGAGLARYGPEAVRNVVGGLWGTFNRLQPGMYR